MNMEKKDFRKLYHAYYQSGKNQTDYEEKKQQFLSHYFTEPAPVFSFHPLFAVPIMCMVFLLIFFQHLQTRFVPQAQMLQSIIYKDKILPLSARSTTSHQSLAQVERATSRVGSVMVYQKLYQDTPVTIVWVFTNRSPGI